LGKFWWVLHWKMLVHFMAIFVYFHLFGICCGHLVYFTVIWYKFFPVAPREIWQPCQELTFLCGLGIIKWSYLPSLRHFHNWELLPAR
jgi:hypothetical protein